MNTEIKQVQTETDAQRVYEFLISPAAFPWEMNEYRKKSRHDGVFGSLTKDHARFWYAQREGQVLGAIGVTELPRENGGYELDYFAVHADARRGGIGKRLMHEVEEFVKQLRGRFIVIDTGGEDDCAPARAFYESCGYKAVGRIPEYYGPGEDRIDYYKRIN